MFFPLIWCEICLGGVNLRVDAAHQPATLDFRFFHSIIGLSDWTDEYNKHIIEKKIIILVLLSPCFDVFWEVDEVLCNTAGFPRLRLPGSQLHDS